MFFVRIDSVAMFHHLTALLSHLPDPPEKLNSSSEELNSTSDTSLHSMEGEGYDSKSQALSAESINSRSDKLTKESPHATENSRSPQNSNSNPGDSSGEIPVVERISKGQASVVINSFTDSIGDIKSVGSDFLILFLFFFVGLPGRLTLCVPVRCTPNITQICATCVPPGLSTRIPGALTPRITAKER